MALWTRQRDNDRWNDYILHEDWIIGDIQFSYRYVVPISEFWGVYMRKKKGRFSCTDWYLINRYYTFEEACKVLNKIIDQDNEKYWHDLIKRVDEKRLREKEERIKKKFCGFDTKKAIGFYRDD